MSMRTLDGFRSRWTIPSEWRWYRPIAHSFIIRIVCAVRLGVVDGWKCSERYVSSVCGQYVSATYVKFGSEKLAKYLTRYGFSWVRVKISISCWASA